MPTLKHHNEFEQILKSYSVSESAQKLLEQIKMVLVLAPFSTGKNTTIKELLKTGRYHYIISDTTRQPRINDGVPEKNGREYWFKGEEEILNGLKNGEYLEAELIHEQQVSGISLKELSQVKDEQKIGVKDVDMAGIHNVLKAKPDTLVILLLPPSYEEWQRRITSRGHMGHAELHRRLTTANRILNDGLKHNFYKYVIADDPERAAQHIDGLAAGEPNRQQDQGRELIHHLKLQLEDKLKTL